jgi:multidrug resistance efflux pump
MTVPGVIKSLPLKAGEEISGEMVLAEIYDEPYVKAVKALEAEVAAAKESKDTALPEILEKLRAAREEQKACVLKNTDILRTTSHGEEALRGIVLEYVTNPATRVDAGETILFVEPHDTFYLFNKTLAILTFIGSICMLVLHKKSAS